MRPLSCLLGLLCSCLLGSVVPLHGGTLARLRVPAWLQLSPVSENMVVNGVSSEVMHLVTSRSTDEVVGLFRKLWNCGSDETVCRRVETFPWSVFSHVDDHSLTYLQIRRAGLETIGYVVRSNLHATTTTHPVVSHMQGSVVHNDLVSEEGGRSARTMLVANSYSMESNKSHYDNTLVAGGWVKVSENANLKGDVVIYRQGHKEASLVLTQKHGRTNVVMTITGKR